MAAASTQPPPVATPPSTAARELEALYPDAVSARIAWHARTLGELIAACQTEDRPVPASVLDAIEDLWRWADGDLNPRGRRRRDGRLTGPWHDSPIPQLAAYAVADSEGSA